MPEEQRERIFSRFARADPVRTRDGQAGAGLGLALSAAFARLQCARLLVTEAPGWGAVFQLWLPG